MKNNLLRNRDISSGKKTTFHMSGTQMCLIGLLCVILDVIYEKFGTYPHYGSGGYSHNEILGIIFPLTVLIFPFIFKKLRERLWTKKNIIISVLTLILSVLLITITYANKDYYWSLWIESGHWDRNNCPPIIWDFWNII